MALPYSVLAAARGARGSAMRAQTPRVLVFDDLLALAPCHVNAIPTAAYIPDIRVLFAHPRRGLALVERLHDAVWGVAEAQFLVRKANAAGKFCITATQVCAFFACLFFFACENLNFP